MLRLRHLRAEQPYIFRSFVKLADPLAVGVKKQITVEPVQFALFVFIHPKAVRRIGRDNNKLPGLNFVITVGHREVGHALKAEKELVIVDLSGKAFPRITALYACLTNVGAKLIETALHIQSLLSLCFLFCSLSKYHVFPSASIKVVYAFVLFCAKCPNFSR